MERLPIKAGTSNGVDGVISTSAKNAMLAWLVPIHRAEPGSDLASASVAHHHELAQDGAFL